MEDPVHLDMMIVAEDAPSAGDYQEAQLTGEKPSLVKVLSTDGASKPRRARVRTASGEVYVVPIVGFDMLDLPSVSTVNDPDQPVYDADDLNSSTIYTDYEDAFTNFAATAVSRVGIGQGEGVAHHEGETAPQPGASILSEFLGSCGGSASPVDRRPRPRRRRPPAIDNADPTPVTSAIGTATDVIAAVSQFAAALVSGDSNSSNAAHCTAAGIERVTVARSGGASSSHTNRSGDPDVSVDDRHVNESAAAPAVGEWADFLMCSPSSQTRNIDVTSPTAGLQRVVARSRQRAATTSSVQPVASVQGFEGHQQGATAFHQRAKQFPSKRGQRLS